MPVIAAIGIGAGCAQHGASDEHERGGERAATPHARRVIVHRVFVRLERSLVVHIEIERAMRVVSAVSVVSVKCIVLLVGGPLLLVGGPGHLLTRLGAQVFDAVRRRIEEILARPIEIGRTGSSCLFGSA